MAELDSIVSITISRESTAVGTAAFNIPLILAETTKFTERTRIYSDLDAVEADFASSDVVHKLATQLFGQKLNGSVPPEIIVGRKEAAESWVDALAAVNSSNSKWYALVAATHDAAAQEALSDAVGARRRIMGISSQEKACITTANTDIGAKLKAKSAGRTFGVYLPTADAEYPEAVWIGSQLGYTPGSNDWDFKRGTGATVSFIDDTARTNLRSKNWNMYTEVGGVNVFQDGNMFDGTPIDEVIGIDWLYARLQEQIFGRYINSLKIDMTEDGLVIIENEIRAVLATAEANKLIAKGWTVSVPTLAQIGMNNRAKRIATGFKFKARLAGSMRKVGIEGTLTV
jgi:hypothetical protein